MEAMENQPARTVLWLAVKAGGSTASLHSQSHFSLHIITQVVIHPTEREKETPRV